MLVDGVAVGPRRVSASTSFVGWVTHRFERILDNAAKRAGRRLRVADELERRAAESLSPIAAAAPADRSALEFRDQSYGSTTPVLVLGADDDSAAVRYHREVWTYDPHAAGPSCTVHSHVHRLRHKLEQAGARQMVQKVRGVGWRLTR